MVSIIDISGALLDILLYILSLLELIPFLFGFVLGWLSLFFSNFITWLLVFEIIAIVYSFKFNNEDDVLMTFLRFNASIFMFFVFIIRFGVNIATRVYDAIVPG